MPFANIWERDTHFAKHGHEFGAADPSEYEQLADAFVDGPLASSTHECTRPGVTDRLRFDFGNYYESVACIAPAFVKTFYIVRTKVVARHGGAAAYFAWDCGRVAGVDL
jgi:hypothetical protein